MDDYAYIKKEAEMLYQYMIEDGEQFKKAKQIYHQIFQSIERSVTCEYGGLDQLDLSIDEIKDIIKQVVDEHPTSLIKP
ncbi:MAG: hypothetical protein K2G70_06355 [Turicibacter sp.]|nr:hypothetical protein [Turicibacter sp.]